MKKPCIFPKIVFIVCVLRIFQYGFLVFWFTTWLRAYKKITKFFRNVLTSYAKLSQIKIANWAYKMPWYKLFFNQCFWSITSSYIYYDIVLFPIILRDFRMWINMWLYMIKDCSNVKVVRACNLQKSCDVYKAVCVLW